MDYARFGRQIALPELGVTGQETLAKAPLVAPAEVRATASRLWVAAGGMPPPDDLARDAGATMSGADAALDLGQAAWWCVESARRALEEVPRELPAELRERLGG